MSEITDDDLMRLCAEGDADAFNVLFARYHAPVFNFALSILRDRHRAEDALQDVFVAVARAAVGGGYKAAGRFRAWLMRVTRNHCLNRVEAERVLRLVPYDELVDAMSPRSEEPSPSDSLESGEQMDLVRAALMELPTRQREALTLYAFEQMRYQEIAAVLDMPINTVKTLIHRARATLVSALEVREGELS